MSCHNLSQALAILTSSDTESFSHELPEAIRYGYCQSMYCHSISCRATTVHLIETGDCHCDKIISVSHQSLPRLHQFPKIS